jgi:hypothetical protein
MSPPIRTGTIYGLFAFMLGFVLGTLRVVAVAPMLGAEAAVLIELPLMLAACWWWSGRIARPPAMARRIEGVPLGLAGLAVLLAGELAVGTLLMGMTPAGWLAEFGRAPAAWGLAAQLMAMAMPMLRWRRGSQFGQREQRAR